MQSDQKDDFGLRLVVAAVYATTIFSILGLAIVLYVLRSSYVV